MASFGMMNEAYFVGKKVLIDWINNFLEVNIEKVEQMATGACYCNLWDAIHPGTMPMSRVDFTVRNAYDFTKNWKLMQNGFKKAGIEKVIPVQRLIKAKYQDNLEFLQWMYKYARDTYNGDPDEPTYDAIGRRSRSKGGREFTGSSKPGASRQKRSRPTSAASRGTARAYTGKTATTTTANRSTGNRRGGAAAASRANDQELEQLRDENKRINESRDQIQGKLDVMQQQHEEIEKIAKDIENERDFYFNKVVAMENRLKEEPDQQSPLLTALFEILYQTEEDMRASASVGPPQGNEPAEQLQDDVGM